MHKAKSIHNHPTGVSSYSFSSDHPSHDMRSFFSENGSVMEAFDEKYRYRFEMPKEKELTGQEWKDAYDRAQYLTEKYLDAKGYTIDDDVSELQQHYRISIACKLLEIEDSYRRWPR